MNTLRPLVITRELQIALYVYTAGVERARRAYAAEPFAGTRELNKLDEAAERMRASRAEKEQANAQARTH